ncbi:DUF4097 family beta strand repeat-containing protein, partial [Candidatus Latescibacterota bacterium]
NGNVSVTVLAGTAPLSAVTVNGSVEVRLHSAYSGQLDAQVGNGDIDSRISLGDAVSTETSLRGQIGGGGEARVELRVTNGDIDVRSA